MTSTRELYRDVSLPYVEAWWVVRPNGAVVFEPSERSWWLHLPSPYRQRPASVLAPRTRNDRLWVLYSLHPKLWRDAAPDFVTPWLVYVPVIRRPRIMDRAELRPCVLCDGLGRWELGMDHFHYARWSPAQRCPRCQGEGSEL